MTKGKKPVFVDQLIFSLAVKAAEASGALATLQVLYDAIAKHYVMICMERKLNSLKMISASIGRFTGHSGRI